MLPLASARGCTGTPIILSNLRYFGTICQQINRFSGNGCQKLLLFLAPLTPPTRIPSTLPFSFLHVCARCNLAGGVRFRKKGGSFNRQKLGVV